MATNIVFDHADQIELDVSGVNGSGTSNLVMSGDPVVVGQLPGVALTDENADGIATVKCNGAATLSVRGHDGTSNAAIAVGAIVYWDDTNGELDVQTAGKRFGYALEAVASGATTAILVKIGY